MLQVKLDMGWTPAEDETVRRMYPDYAGMRKVLRHRSYHALRSRSATLNVVENKHVWTTTENKKLTEMWRSASKEELKAAFPNVTYMAIKSHGRDLGFGPREKPALVATGNDVRDAIRDRCRELGYSMKYLDEIAGTGRYFQAGNFHDRPEHAAPRLARAIDALGGVVSVDFPD